MDWTTAAQRITNALGLLVRAAYLDEAPTEEQREAYKEAVAHASYALKQLHPLIKAVEKWNLIAVQGERSVLGGRCSGVSSAFLISNAVGFLSAAEVTALVELIDAASKIKGT